MNTIIIEDKEYKVRELKGMDLFVFFKIADKLNIDAEKINASAGKIEYLDEEAFAKAHPELKGDNLALEFRAYINSQASGAMSLGIITFLIKKSHLVKNEINDLISAAWDMELSTIKNLSLNDYMSVLKGALQIKAITEAFKSFFQLDNQK